MLIQIEEEQTLHLYMLKALKNKSPSSGYMMQSLRHNSREAVAKSLVRMGSFHLQQERMGVVCCLVVHEVQLAVVRNRLVVRRVVQIALASSNGDQSPPQCDDVTQSLWPL